MDYVAETPYWAVYGAAERGMDPEENRWYHNRTVRRAKVRHGHCFAWQFTSDAVTVCSITQEGKLSKEIMDEYLENPANQKHTMGSGEANPFEDEKQAE